MVRNFLFETPLAPSAREVLLDAFDQGWHDPLKLSQGASKARNLRHEATESIAERLRTHPTELEFIGEPSLGHFLAIRGLLAPKSRIFHSTVDRKEVQAIARDWGSSVNMTVDARGGISPGSLAMATGEDLLALQGANGETGVLQECEALCDQFLALTENGRINLDFTTIGAHRPLPSQWDCALFDSRAWQGPQGLGILAIRTGSAWRNPLPHLDSARSPQSFSLPLLIATAVALETWRPDEEKVRQLSLRLRNGISSSISNCDIAGDLNHSLPHINSFSFLYVEGEELLRALEKRGFLVDSGSACTSQDLQPSHVLAAMGLLTHGNIRVTIRPETNEEDIDDLIVAIQMSVDELRQ